MWDGVGVGWDSVFSHLLKRKTEVYINLPPNYHCTLLQHRTKLRWKEINPHKKPSLVPFPPSSLCHIFYIVIVYNSTVNTYYQSPKPELVLLPSPPSRFLHCCCRQLLYHQFSRNSCGIWHLSVICPLSHLSTCRYSDFSQYIGLTTVIAVF